MKNKDGKHKQLSSRQLVSTWRRVLLFFIIHSSLSITPLFADPIGDLLGRILPHNGDARKFEWTVAGGNTQQFTLSCNGKKVTVSGSDNVAVATGINWYLQHYAGIDISWNAPTGRLPKKLPYCNTEKHTASVPWRYYLNFCTCS